MASLIYKDFIILRKNLIILFCSVVLLSCMPFMILVDDAAAEAGLNSFLALFIIMVYAMVFVVMGMFMTAPFEPDERKKWADFITSSPQGIKRQIGAKYYYVLILGLFELFWCMTLEYIYMAVFPEMEFSALSLCVMFFYFQLFIYAVEIPFLIRFGSKVGGMYRAALAIFIILIIVVYALFGDLSRIGSIESFYDFILSLVDGEDVSNGFLFVSAISPYIAVALFYLSYRLSCKLYLKGVEEYDK